MRRFLHWYGAGPLSLLTMLASFALAGYAAAGLLPHHVIGIAVWFVGAVIGHDLLLMPLYTLADRSAQAVFRHRPPSLPAVPWINYLRVPAGLSGLLLLIWFPLIFRLPTRFPFTTTLPLDPYLWHWLGVTGALFLLSATALALRLGAVQHGARIGRTSDDEDAEMPAVTAAEPRGEAPDASVGAHSPLPGSTSAAPGVTSTGRESSRPPEQAASPHGTSGTPPKGSPPAAAPTP